MSSTSCQTCRARVSDHSDSGGGRCWKHHASLGGFGTWCWSSFCGQRSGRGAGCRRAWRNPYLMIRGEGEGEDCEALYKSLETTLRRARRGRWASGSPRKSKLKLLVRTVYLLLSTEVLPLSSLFSAGGRSVDTVPLSFAVSAAPSPFLLF